MLILNNIWSFRKLKRHLGFVPWASSLFSYRLQIVKLFAESLDHVGQLEATSLFHYLKPRKSAQS